MQGRLDAIVQWLSEHALRFSEAKAEAMVITRTRKIEVTNLNLYGKPIKWVTTFIYLGIMIHFKLNWKFHIEYAVDKATSAYHQIRKMVGKNWGLQPKQMKWLYTDVIRQSLAYGAGIWIKGIERKGNVKQLERIQILACRAITGSKRSMSTASIQVITGIDPIDIYLKKVALTFMTRMIDTQRWDDERPGIKSHTHYTNELAKSLLLDLQVKRDVRYVPTYISPLYQIDIRDRNSVDIKDTPAGNEIIIYSDGSKDETGNTGSACILTDHSGTEEKLHKLQSHTTVFQAEIYGIYSAAHSLKEDMVSGKEIYFYIDSQAAIRALYTTSSRSLLVERCKLLLNKICERGNTLILRWCPAHQGYQLNEQVDELAKKASTLAEEAVTVPISLAVQKQLIKRQVNCLVNEFWSETSGNRIPKIWFPLINPKKSVDILRLSRRHIKVLMQILTGHSELAYFQHKIGLIDSPICAACDMYEETVEHFIGVCIAHSYFRKKFLDSFIIHPWEFEYLPIKALMSYITHTRRFEELIG